MSDASEKSPLIPTQKALAEIVGRERTTVCLWLKRDDWPLESRVAPWKMSDVPKLLRWVASLGPQGKHEAPDEETVGFKRAKLGAEGRRLLAQANLAELQLAKERGKLVDVEAVAAEWARICSLIRTAFENLASEIIPIAQADGMRHEALPGFQEKVDAKIRGVLRILSASNRTNDDDSEDGPASAGSPVSA